MRLSGWTDSATADNALATVTRTARPHGIQHFITAVSGSYDSAAIGALVLKAESKNLLLHSEAFDNAAWIKFNCTVTPNTAVAPDGEQTMDTLTTAGVEVFDHVAQSTPLTSEQSYVLSVFVAAGTSLNSVVQLRDEDALVNIARAAISWLNGVPSITREAGDASDVEPIGDGVYRVWVSATTAAGSINHEVEIHPDRDAVGRSMKLWGAQLEEGSSPTSYAKTEGSISEELARWHVHNRFSLALRSGIAVGPGNDAVLELAASGTGGISGTAVLDGFTV